jgi:hypothetical protein
MFLQYGLIIQSKWLAISIIPIVIFAALVYIYTSLFILLLDMSISNNQTATEMPDKEAKIEAINNRQKASKTFHETHRPRMEVKPNVEYTVFLSRDWWMTPIDSEKDWIMRDESREYDNPKTGKKEMIHDTTYRVRQLSSTDPLFLQELHLGKNAAEIFGDVIKETAVLDPDRDLIITFMKVVGATQYDVTWKVKARLA